MSYDYGGYERSKGDIDYKYSTDAATNAYGRFISQQRGQRNLGDMSQAFGRQMPRHNAAFGARGLGGGEARSGVYQRSMNNFVGDYARDYGRAQQDMTLEGQQYDLNQFNNDAWRQQALQDLETNKANEIATAAENLQYLRQALGGL